MNEERHSTIREGLGLGQSRQKYAMETAAEAVLPREQTVHVNEQQGEEELQSCHNAFDEDTPSKPWNFIIPLSLVLTLTLFLSWWDGHFKATSFLNAFIRSDALGVMLESLLITFIVTLA